MKLYALSTSWRRQRLIDAFDSLIWTERFDDHGDFELKMRATRDMKNLLTPGTFMIHDETIEPQIIETVQIVPNQQSVPTMVVKGRSATTLLEQRCTPAIKMPENETHSYAGYAMMLIDGVIVTGGAWVSTSSDRIPSTSIKNVSSDASRQNFEPRWGVLYDDVQDLLRNANSAIKCTFGEESPRLRFRIFDGTDRKNVVFRTRDDSLISPSYLESNKAFKNVLYTKFKSGTRKYHKLNDDDEVDSGLDRRVAFLDLTSLDPNDYKDVPGAYSLTIDRMSKRYLRSLNYINAIDGTFNEESRYQYGKSYFLGDRVYLQGEFDDAKVPVVIKEFIWSISPNEDRSYPTFEVASV